MKTRVPRSPREALRLPKSGDPERAERLHCSQPKAAQREPHMRTFMIDILLQGLDDETRMRLLPAEQAIIKTWLADGTLLASYIKQDVAGIYLVLKANDAQDADSKLSTLPYYPYMKISMVALR